MSFHTSSQFHIQNRDASEINGRSFNAIICAWPGLLAAQEGGQGSQLTGPILFLDVRLKALDEILDCQVFDLIDVLRTAGLLRWDQHVPNDLDDTVLGNAILDHDSAEAVDLDSDETSVASNVNAKVLVIEQGGKIDLTSLVKIRTERGK